MSMTANAFKAAGEAVNARETTMDKTITVLSRRWQFDSSNVRLEYDGDIYWVRWLDYTIGQCGRGWKNEAEARSDFASFIPKAPQQHNQHYLAWLNDQR